MNNFAEMNNWRRNALTPDEKKCPICGVSLANTPDAIYARALIDKCSLGRADHMTFHNEPSPPEVVVPDKLITRLRESKRIIAGLHSNRLEIQMSIPPQEYDTDIFTISAIDEAIERIGRTEAELAKTKAELKLVLDRESAGIKRHDDGRDRRANFVEEPPLPKDPRGNERL